MQRVRSLLSAGLVGTSLLLAGCMGDVIPGADVADPSCVLLCALQRQFTAAPAVPPTAAAPPRTRVAVLHHPAIHRRPAVVLHEPERIAPKRAHRRPMAHRATAHVSVVPRGTPQAPPVALATPGPAPVAAAHPIEAPAVQSLSQAIPGSAGIMTPAWRGQ